MIENYKTFVDELNPILDHLQKIKSEVIIAGDFNIDLLKFKEKPILSDYYDTITTQGIIPKITLPTRFSEHYGTLIENFLCKLTQGYLNSTAGILVRQMSDYLPYFICQDCILTTDTVPKFIQIKQQNLDSLERYRLKLINSNIHGKLNKKSDGNPNENYNILDEAISIAVFKYLPTKTVKYNKHKYKKSPWIIQGIIRSITFTDKLYLKTKQTPINTTRHQILKNNLHTYKKFSNEIFD